MNYPLLLAESGASKTEWVLLEPENLFWLGQTSGFNPNVQQRMALQKQLETEAPRVRPASVLFYGAAYSSFAYCEEMKGLLQAVYPGASIEVAHDLLGAARSVAADSPAVVGILGTGSSACQYDGHAIVEVRGGHGYLFGDEGSGAYLGKSLLQAGLNQLLKHQMVEDLEAFLGCRLLDFRNEVYRDPKPNVRLAELSHFLEAHRVAFQPLLLEGFVAFLTLHVQPLMAAEHLPWHAVGSIAQTFAPELVDACHNVGITAPGSIIKRPIEGLIRYHQQKLRST